MSIVEHLFLKYAFEPLEPEEIFYDSINLTSSGGGFSLNNAQTWTPQIASLKGGGSWLDAADKDGRRLQTISVQNVTETINLVLSGGTAQEVYSALAKMNTFLQRAREFSAEFYPVNPVYLDFKAIGAPEAQYAIVYSGEISYTFSSTQTNFIADVVLTLEREPAWRASPPGGVPEFNASGNNTNANAGFELASYFGASYANTLNNNSMVGTNIANNIPLNFQDIKGDAPALVQLSISIVGSGTARLRQLFISRVTKPAKQTTITSTTGSTRPYVLSLNAADSTGFSLVSSPFGLTVDANYGLPGAGTTWGADRYVALFSGGNTSLSWPAKSNSSPRITQQQIDLNSLRGKHNVFVRGKQLNGAAGDVQLTATFTQSNGKIKTLQGTARFGRGSDVFDWTFLGTIQLPLDKRSIGVGGVGVNNQNTYTDLDSVSLTASLSGGATYRLTDLIFVPYDEQTVVVKVENSTETIGFQTVEVQSTGYLDRASHGTSVVTRVFETGASAGVSVSTIGDELTFLPGQENNLYFWGYTTSDTVNEPQCVLTVVAEYIPRWYGIRDA